MPYMENTEGSEPKKLILCFDGTGNTFSGSNADTNVVKILSKLDRNHPNQYHYYQTGIGTYDIGETSVNKTYFGEMKSSISQTLDQGFGMTFDAHVIAGYRFLMRYYESGAKIYIFGFSRGAFTAKFLARMVNKVGLLCKGNEEMVPFAFRLYQRYLAGDIQDRVDAQGRCEEDHGDTDTGSDADPLLAGNTKVHRSHTTEVALNEITAFSQTFCRKEKAKPCDDDDDDDGDDDQEEDQNIKVFFLGIWDCVNSVAVLERKTPVPVPVTGTARYVRHAVAVDERRVKFKPALLAQDIRVSKHNHDDEDIKEVWFAGCHGDVGGGWPSTEDNPLDNNKAGDMSFWQRVKNFWTSRKAKEPSKNINDDRLQMSDIPLAWMIREVELVGQKEPEAAVKWCDSLEKFKAHINDKENKEQALKGFMHDSLAFGYGTGFFKVLMWKFMEYLPFITRWELEQAGWVNVRFPLNKGAARDIPQKAVLHASLVKRLREDPEYWPTNNHGSDTAPCLKRSSDEVQFQEHREKNKKDEWIKVVESDPDHQTYDIVHIVQ